LTVRRQGQPVAKVVDDLVAAELDGPPSEPFKEIEVEMIGDNETAIIEPVIATLVDRGCERETDPMPKAIRMLGPRAVDPPDVELPMLTKHSSLYQFLSAIIAGPVRQLIEHHAGTVLGDVDAVHDFRVATRRLRSNLKSFGALVDPTWATWLRDELAWLGGEVGIERDAGVLAAHLGEQAETLPAQDAPAIELLFAEVHEDGTSAHQHVLGALQGDRYLALLVALVDAARAPRLAAPVANRGDEPAVTHVLPLVRKPWRKLKGAAKCLTPESPDPAYHAARIRAKRARYAAEAVVPLFGGAARRYARTMEKIQSILGEHQDAVVAEQWLRDAAIRAPAAGVAAGELAALQRTQRVKLRRQFRSAWKKAARPKLRSWMRRR
jgi:CHAD domain-containing protein